MIFLQQKMVREGCLDVRVVESVSGVQLPEVTHAGKNYVVAQPGMEWRVEINQHSNTYVKANLWIDGDRVKQCIKKTSSRTSVFPGYPIDSEHTRFSSFKFAATEVCEPGAGAGVVPGKPSDAGTIEVELLPIKNTPLKKQDKKRKRASPAAVQPGTLNVGSKGEKFFLSPSLSTQAGSLVAREQKSKRTKSIVIGASIQTVLIHTETLETLKLRQVPIPQVSRWWYRKVSSHMHVVVYTTGPDGTVFRSARSPEQWCCRSRCWWCGSRCRWCEAPAHGPCSRCLSVGCDLHR